MKEITIHDKKFQALHVKTDKSNLLAIYADKGFLGCGYFQIETANNLNEAVAIVTAVKNHADMLQAEIIKTSNKAKELGVAIGDKGIDALIKFSASL